MSCRGLSPASIHPQAPEQAARSDPGDKRRDDNRRDD